MSDWYDLSKFVCNYVVFLEIYFHQKLKFKSFRGFDLLIWVAEFNLWDFYFLFLNYGFYHKLCLICHRCWFIFILILEFCQLLFGRKSFLQCLYIFLRAEITYDRAFFLSNIYNFFQNFNIIQDDYQYFLVTRSGRKFSTFEAAFRNSSHDARNYHKLWIIYTLLPGKNILFADLLTLP